MALTFAFATMHFPFLAKIHGGRLEQPTLIMRKHPVILVGNLLLFALLGLAPVAAILLLPDLILEWLAKPALGPAIVLLASVFELFILQFLYASFLDWYLDIWVVTDERIIDIDQSGVFGREMHELQLANLQDVTVQVRGILATLLGFGTISVQSAGAKSQFEFAGLPRPSDVAKRILELAEADKMRHTVTERSGSPIAPRL